MCNVGTIPRTKQICRARAISVSDLVANSLLGNQPKDRKAKRIMTLDLTTSLINNHLPLNKNTVRKKCSISCTIINEMARRPARCYRYCKNKVSAVFWNYAQCVFCGRRTLPVAQASQGPHQLLFDSISLLTPNLPTAISQVPLQPWCPRSQNSHFRSGPQACQRR